MSTILIVEDERVLAKNIREKLTAHGFETHVAHSGTEALAVASRAAPDIAVLDLRLPDGDGLTLLPRLRAETGISYFIVVTAHGNERVAVEAMKAGAFEYLSKPVDLEELLIVVGRAIEHQQLSDNLRFLRSREEQCSGLDQIIGESDATRSLKETLRRLTRNDVLALPDPPTVLITGETGTGKDLVARAIHYLGPRRTRPFIHVNCTALPASLFESEIFGHLRGSFTGASQTKRGLFEVAHGGTIFLDEIGHLAPEMQAKLLMAIERREIRPVGATDVRAIDVHVIAATNRDLRAAVDQGLFRDDLYHRLRVVEIALKPLRQRTDDLPPLVAHFLASHSRRFGLPHKTLTSEALGGIMQYAWPGNVRELGHVIESTVLQTEGDTIRLGDLRLPPSQTASGLQVEMPRGRTIRLDFEKGEPRLDEVEQAILSAAFEFTGQNLSRAARILGITREALRYRLHKGTESVRPTA